MQEMPTVLLVFPQPSIPFVGLSAAVLFNSKWSLSLEPGQNLSYGGILLSGKLNFFNFLLENKQTEADKFLTEIFQLLKKIWFLMKTWKFWWKILLKRFLLKFSMETKAITQAALITSTETW